MKRPRRLDLTGQVFGYWTVLYKDGCLKNGEPKWRCRCKCGNERTVIAHNLRNGRSQSCGCRHSERMTETHTKHGLTVSHPRLYRSIREHFRFIRTKFYGYRRWTIDPRYSDDIEGVIKFCKELISLQPEMCARYETDKSLDLDKDNGGLIFCPECIVFRDSSENRGKRYSNLMLSDGTHFTTFLHKVGVQTCDGHGNHTNIYDKYRKWSKKHNGEGHPELIKRANELIALYTKTLKLLKLREDVREFASRVSLSSH